MLVDVSALHYSTTAFHLTFHSFLLIYMDVQNDVASVISDREHTLRDLHTVETPVTNHGKCQTWVFVDGK